MLEFIFVALFFGALTTDGDVCGYVKEKFGEDVTCVVETLSPVHDPAGASLSVAGLRGGPPEDEVSTVGRGSSLGINRSLRARHN